MFVDTQCFHLTVTNSLCQSTTITARSIIDFTDHFIVHHWTRYRKLQWYNDSMNNDNNQWSTSPICIWCRKVQWYNEQWQWWKPSYWPQRLEATETAAGFQAKFGHMSPDILVTECLETSAFSGQNFALPWQNCLYWWCLIPRNWWITCHIKLSAMDKAMRRSIWNKCITPFELWNILRWIII